MMMCFRGNRDEFYGEVLLLDGRRLPLTSEQGIKRSSKAAAIFQLVASHLNLVQVQFFGLRFCDVKQRSFWLDPTRTLLQHQELIGPPYIFYFGVKFYVEDPVKLPDETTRGQFYLQLRQDIQRGVLPCPAHLKPHLLALMLQADRGDHCGETTSEDQQEVQLIHRTLSGVPRLQAQNHFLSLCSSLQMYGVTLFAACGQNHTEYFLGPTPVGVVIFKNKVLVGKYLWQRITKLRFKDETFELQVCSRNGSEASFFFQMYDRCDCRRLWRCCVEHHAFFRMSDGNTATLRLKHSSFARSSSLTLPRLKGNRLKSLDKKTAADDCAKTKPFTNQKASEISEQMIRQMAPAAVQRSEGGATVDLMKPSAPWENSQSVKGLFNPKFPSNIREEQGGQQRRSRSLDGDRPTRGQRRRSSSHGNTSSGSESGRMSAGKQRHRRRSPDAQIWKHIQKQLVEPEGLNDRQTEEIPYKEVRVSAKPIRMHRSSRGRRHRRWASASELRSKVEVVLPLSVTMATATYPAEGPLSQQGGQNTHDATTATATSAGPLRTSRECKDWKT
ncbi:PREDICTED: band 4.1-like protein 4A [Cyprinodon variegatus]|uniref:band 4.1-like protein 4A n=1 Tax=Cyprinodon variegatus TaxID=28743 RepID=UPI0007429B27|nr:PREDICTED: band 4.1-like protein 4A [Cyprinodon variegatus]